MYFIFLVTIFATISKLSPALNFLLPKVHSRLDFCFYLNIGASMVRKNILLENTKDLMGNGMTKKAHATSMAAFRFG